MQSYLREESSTVSFTQESNDIGICVYWHWVKNDFRQTGERFYRWPLRHLHGSKWRGNTFIKFQREKGEEEIAVQPTADTSEELWVSQIINIIRNSSNMPLEEDGVSCTLRPINSTLTPMSKPVPAYMFVWKTRHQVCLIDTLMTCFTSGHDWTQP